MVVTTNYLEELGEKHFASKRMLDYLRRYWLFFKDVRLDVKKVVEIGVASGASLRMWAEFFPDAKIYGIDVDPSCRVHTQDRITVTVADSTNPNDMGRFAADLGSEIANDWGRNDAIVQRGQDTTGPET